MAIAQRGSLTTAVQLSTGTTSATVNKPTGVVSGDVVIIVVYSNSLTDPSLPSGFTNALVGNHTSGGARFRVCYRVCDGSEGSTFTSTVVDDAWRIMAIAYSGVNTSSVWDVSPTTSSSGTSAPDLAAGTAGRRLIGGGSDLSASSWTPPSGWTELHDASWGAGGATYAHKDDTSGNADSGDFTPNANFSGHQWTAALEPGPNTGAATGGYAFAGSSTGVAPFNAPTGLVATAVSNTEIDLAWDVHPEAVWYEVERDSVVIARWITTNSYSDTGLTPATSYTYRVRAVKNHV